MIVKPKGKDFKIRASMIRAIMTQPQAKEKKEGKPSVTTQAYLKEWLIEKMYGQKKEFKSKYTDKGNEVEDAGIDLIVKHLQLGMAIKNTERFENDFFTGEPDILIPDTVIDNKSVWSVHSFPILETDLPKKYEGYNAQIQGYMALTDRPKGKLIFTLINTPDGLVEREVKSYCWENGIDFGKDDITEVYQEIKSRHVYDQFELKHRIKEFEVYRDNDFIEAVEEQVEECREYLDEVLIRNIK